MASERQEQTPVTSDFAERAGGRAAQTARDQELQTGRRRRERRATEVRPRDIIGVTLHVALYVSLLVVATYIVAFVTFLVAL